MSSPVPRILIGGAEAAVLLEQAERCKRAVEVVEVYLVRQDFNGANEFMEEFASLNGDRLHNVVMKMLEEIFGLPDWRTFS